MEKLLMRHESELYKELPKKICVECGKEIEEKSESYVFECERCINTHEDTI